MNYFLTEIYGFRQLNNETFYEKYNESIHPRTKIKLTSILNKFKSTGATSEKNKTMATLSPPQEQRPQYFYMLPKIHKETSFSTILNIMRTQEKFSFA